MFKNYIDGLFNDKIILKSQQSDSHNVYIEQINNIALSSNDDKILQSFDKITTYPYGANAFQSMQKRDAKQKYKLLILIITWMKIRCNII